MPNHGDRFHLHPTRTGGLDISPVSVWPQLHTDYRALAEVLGRALDQAQSGKGKERHANDRPFTEQPILTIGRMVGPGYQLGQAMKKAQEAMRLPTTERKVAELLGAINYLAAAIILLEESHAPQADLP